MSSETVAVDKWKQTNVMLPVELRRILIARAHENGRSMSSEIVVRLADSVGAPHIRPVGRIREGTT